MKPKLYTHKEVSILCGVTSRLMRDWCERGHWPRPHAIIERTWFYRVEDVDHFVATGTWPEGMRYRPGVGSGLEALPS